MRRAIRLLMRSEAAVIIAAYQVVREQKFTCTLTPLFSLAPTFSERYGHPPFRETGTTM